MAAGCRRPRRASACATGSSAGAAARGLVARRIPSSTHSPFPDSPVFTAELVRTELGGYKATLLLPDGQQETLSGNRLDAVRARVIGVARGYLRTYVGRPGRLRVQDPDGTWLLGVPLDNSDLVPLTAGTLTALAAATPAEPVVGAPRAVGTHRRVLRFSAAGAVMLCAAAVAVIALGGRGGPAHAGRAPVVADAAPERSRAATAGGRIATVDRRPAPARSVDRDVRARRRAGIARIARRLASHQPATRNDHAPVQLDQPRTVVVVTTPVIASRTGQATTPTGEASPSADPGSPVPASGASSTASSTRIVTHNSNNVSSAGPTESGPPPIGAPPAP